MQRFYRMHENCWRSSGVKSCGNFASDQSTLAHAGYNYSPRTGMKQFDAMIESLRHVPAKAVSEILQSSGLYPDNIFPNAVHGKRMVAGNRRK